MRHLLTVVLLLLLVTACSQEPPATVGFLQADVAFAPVQERVQIIDIFDETQPQLQSELIMPAAVVEVVAGDSFLYVLHNTSATSWDSATGPPDAGLQIIEISDPTEPQLRGFFRTITNPTDMVLHNNLVLVADRSTITVVDVSNPDAPHNLNTIRQEASGLALNDNLLVSSWGGCSFRSGFCSGGLHLFDLTDPTRPQPIGQMNAELAPGDNLPGHDVALSDGHALATGKGVWVVNLADPLDMQIDGRYARNDGLLFRAKIAVVGDIAYTLQADGLHLLDISQPAAPVLLGTYLTPNYLTHLTIRDGRAYLAGWNGLEIVDVSDPSNPWQLGSYTAANPIPSSPLPTATP